MKRAKGRLRFSELSDDVKLQCENMLGVEYCNEKNPTASLILQKLYRIKTNEAKELKRLVHREKKKHGYDLGSIILTL